jgi:hypothetical protein
MAIELSELVVPLTMATAGFMTGVGVAVAGAAAVGAAIVGTVKATIDLAEKYDDLGDKLGISGNEAAGYILLLKESGVETETFTKAMLINGKGLVDLEGKLGPTGKAYASLGISVYDANGNLKTATTLFEEAAPIISAIKDPTERARIEMQLFGKAGAELNDTIDIMGAQGMPALSAQAEKLGLAMSPERVAAVEQMGRKWEEFKAAIMGVTVSIGLAFMPILDGLMPVLNNLIGFISSTAVPWIQINLPKAIQVLSDYWTTVLQPAIKIVWDWMSTVLMPFLQNTVVPWLEVTIPAAIQTLSDFWTNVLQPAIATVWSWISGTLIPFFQNTVVPWLQTNIPVALQTLSDFWTNVLQPAITKVWSWISGTLIPFFQNTVVPILQVTIPAAIKILSDIWENILLPVIRKIYDFLFIEMMPIWKLLGELLSVTIKLAIETCADIWQNVLMPVFTKVYNYIKDYVVPWFTKIGTGVDGITTAIKTVVGWIETLITKLSNIKLPAVLTPHSPTPFEMGIRGITSAMTELNDTALNDFNANLNINKPEIRGGPQKNTEKYLFDYDKLGSAVARAMRMELQRV